MSDAVQVVIEGHVAIVTMNNPPANTWTRDSLEALTDLVHELNANKDVYSLIITGQGDKFFSAGADLKLSLIHISEPTRRVVISYAVFCLKKKK